MISELANHLWQSTLFAVAVGLLTLMCRKNHASVRYWLWFSASVKFFIPFTVLMALGDRLEWASSAPQIATPAVSATLAQVSRPFVEDPGLGVLSLQEAPRGFDWFAFALLAVWVSGIIAMTVIRLRMWQRIRAAVRASSPWTVPDLPLPAGLDVRSTPGVMEPGVVGLWRPVLLVPSGIEDDLTPRQLAAVLTHELCHVRRRDNVTAAVHMLAEAVFWFHPLVWWIGARLVDERERACDEEVVRTFGAPQTYAEGIVNVCKRYVESPLACVSGVSGANVKNRIRAIMTNRTIAKLSAAKKVVLAAVGTVAVVAPMLAQSVPLPSATELRFEVASVKRATDASGKVRVGDQVWTSVGARFMPGGAFEAVNATLGSVIRLAYGLREFQTVGGPEWVDTERFDIQARGPQGAVESEAPPATPIPSRRAVRPEGAQGDEGPSDLCARARAREWIAWPAAAPIAGTARTTGPRRRRRTVHATGTSGPRQHEALRGDDGEFGGHVSADVHRAQGRRSDRSDRRIRPGPPFRQPANCCGRGSRRRSAHVSSGRRARSY